jgi:hypothetical protein
LSISGTNYDDTLAGTDGNDAIGGGNGNDTITGGAGNDSLSGGNGNDMLDGGAGDDTVSGGNGDDTAVYVALDNAGAADAYDGGNGTDTLVLKLTQAQLNEMNASSVFGDFRAANTSTWFDFAAYHFSFDIHLTARSFEQIRTVVIDPPPAAHADVNTIAEDGPASVDGNVLANDTDDGIAQTGLSVVNAGVLQGLYGTLTINADGSYSYEARQRQCGG